MLKKILAIVAMLYAFAAFAAVDVNKANAAELDSIKGIGPAVSGKILDERKKGSFKDWEDFITRVKGVGETNAAIQRTRGQVVSSDRQWRRLQGRSRRSSQEKRKSCRQRSQAGRKDRSEDA